jgi:hypothetical protein
MNPNEWAECERINEALDRIGPTVDKLEMLARELVRVVRYDTRATTHLLREIAVLNASRANDDRILAKMLRKDKEGQ